MTRHFPVWTRRVWVIPAVFFIFFLGLPLVVLTWETLSIEAFRSFLSSTPWSIALLASIQSVISVAISLLIGIPIAGVLARYQFIGRSVLTALVTVPFVLPTVVVALGFRSLFGDVVEPGLLLVVLAHAYINIAVITRVVGAQWSTIDQRTVIVARTLGASPWRVFRTLTLPVLTPSILAASCIVFVFSFTSLGIVTILGDGSSTRTLEQNILRQSSVLLDFPGALASALLQLLVVGFVFALAARTRRGFGGSDTPGVRVIETLNRPRSTREKLWVGTIAILAFTLVVAPIASIVIASFGSATGLSLQWWTALGELNSQFARIGSPLDALLLSLSIAVFTALIAAFVGGAAAISVMGRNPLIAVFSLIPLGLSAATLGLGTLLAFGRAPLDLRDTGLLIPIAHALVAVPLVVAVAAPALRNADPRRLIVASSLGAHPNRAWWTAYGGLVRTVMLAAGGLAGAVSLGEFGAASFLARADSPTVPVQIAKLLSRPGEAAYATAAVLSVVLVIGTVALMMLVERLNTREVQHR